MKHVGILIIMCIMLCLPCNSAPIPINAEFRDNKIVFVYHIPDEDENKDNSSIKPEEQENKIPDIISDDITADTSGIPNIYDNDDYYLEDEEDDYLISDMYTDVLKGYAVYNEEDENEDRVELNPEYPALALNISQPYKIQAKKYTTLQNSESLYDNVYTKFNGSEYVITPISNKHTSHFGGGLSSGTLYEQEISYGELEQSSGVFSRYEYKVFALTTSYTKTINTTNNNYNDKFAITPELKLGQYFTLKNKLSADTVKKRKKAELILSINPFGKRDLDRLKFDFIIGETYDEVSNSFWNRFEFYTTFKL